MKVLGAAAMVTATLAFAASPGTALAGPVYDGKNVVLVVPNSPAGLMTQYARMIAPFIEKHSGAKMVRVENRTGAGGLKGTNTVWNEKPDGMTIAFTNVPALILAQLADSPGVQFDATKFTYLGRAASEPRVLVVGTVSDIKTMEDIQKLGRPFAYASQGTDEDFYATSVIADVFGFKLKAITGYEGQSDTALAAIKGDLDGYTTGWVAAKPVVDAGEVRVIAVLDEKRLTDLPDVPSVVELATDDSKKSLLSATITIMNMSRGFFGPPDMDPAATEEMRAAIEASLKDPELLAAADKAGVSIIFAPGAEQQEKVAEILAASEDLKSVLKASIAALQ
ncbi:Bug family tripartite tricarboxylate transporter substrate binding protein [Faunimonas sp. B44]|uniref:Bug family tripartite tricarboxylate transporter substrate binding protein n=1 Tax=Faunimonas sp. B44 TaxID=3461493 RepID=UPI00404439F2